MTDTKKAPSGVPAPLEATTNDTPRILTILTQNTPKKQAPPDGWESDPDGIPSVSCHDVVSGRDAPGQAAKSRGPVPVSYVYYTILSRDDAEGKYRDDAESKYRVEICRNRTGLMTDDKIHSYTIGNRLANKLIRAIRQCKCEIRPEVNGWWARFPLPPLEIPVYPSVNPPPPPKMPCQENQEAA